MAVKPEEKIFEMVHMFRDLAVKHHKDFTEQEKHVQNNSVGHNFRKRLDLLFTRIKARIIVP